MPGAASGVEAQTACPSPYGPVMIGYGEPSSRSSVSTICGAGDHTPSPPSSSCTCCAECGRNGVSSVLQSLIACSAVCVAAFAIPAVLGVTVPTLVTYGLLYGIAGIICGEPMYKVWSQELFPTQYRSSAQGITIAFTRVVAAVAALFTPLIIEYGPQVLFYFLITTTVVAACPPDRR